MQLRNVHRFVSHRNIETEQIQHTELHNLIYNFEMSIVRFPNSTTTSENSDFRPIAYLKISICIKDYTEQNSDMY